jgi:hypothetical protein
VIGSWNTITVLFSRDMYVCKLAMNRLMDSYACYDLGYLHVSADCCVVLSSLLSHVAFIHLIITITEP